MAELSDSDRHEHCAWCKRIVVIDEERREVLHQNPVCQWFTDNIHQKGGVYQGSLLFDPDTGERQPEPQASYS